MYSGTETIEINGKTFGKFIDRSEIQRIVTLLADRLNEDYRDKDPIFLIVLKGSVFFGSDLLRHITINCEMDTIRARSYGDSMTSSGIVRLDNLSFNCEGRHVVIIEDIVDTGLTLEAMYKKLLKLNPASVAAVTMLSKPAQRKVKVEVQYIGMEIEPVFVIGYGLDYAERGRHLPDIYRLTD